MSITILKKYDKCYLMLDVLYSSQFTYYGYLTMSIFL